MNNKLLLVSLAGCFAALGVCFLGCGPRDAVRQPNLGVTYEDDDGASDEVTVALKKTDSKPSGTTQLEKRPADVDQSPRLITFNNDGDKCSIEVIRPMEPPRSLLTYNWTSPCSTIQAISTHEDKVLLRSENGSAILNVRTGTLKNVPELSGLYSLGFNSKGEVLAAATLSSAIETNDSLTKAWIVWDGRTYKVSPDVLDWGASVDAIYKLHGSSWKTVKTELVEFTGHSAPLFAEEEGIQEFSSNYQRGFRGTDYDYRKGSIGLDVEPSNEDCLFSGWAFSPKGTPQVGAIYGYEGCEALTVFGAPLTWFRNGKWEVIPGTNVEEKDRWSADFNKGSNHLTVFDGKAKSAQAFDLRTHQVIWQGTSFFCPVWIY